MPAAPRPSARISQATPQTRVGWKGRASDTQREWPGRQEPPGGDIELRAGQIADRGDIASMLYSSGPGMYDFIFNTDRHTSKEYIEYEYRSGRGFCGCRNVTVAVAGGVVVGVGTLYDGRKYGKLLAGSGLNMLRFFGPLRVWPVILRSRHMDSVMRAPRQDELYLANLGVAPAWRGRGIGTRMIRHMMEQTRDAGYRRWIFDVDEDNHRALKLYLRIGFKIVGRKTFSGRRAGYQVPGTFELELNFPAPLPPLPQS